MSSRISDDDIAALEVGYDIPARPGMAEVEVETPALIVDLDVLERNIDRMQAAADAAGVRLRAHGKTHKSLDIADMQIARGACGICCQKVSEAEVFVRGGIMDVMITNEIRGAAKIDRLARLPLRGARVIVCVDDIDNVAELSEAAVRHGTVLEVAVEIDVGQGRCGVAPGAPAVAIARAAAAAPGLIFAGLQAYHGRAQHFYDWDERRAAIEAAVAMTRVTVDALAEVGLTCAIVAGAGTGTHALEAASGVYNELQCGSYVFMDADYGRVLAADGRPIDGFENALFLLTSVMSHAKPDRAVVDAGLKVQSVDSGLPKVFGRDDVTYVHCSDEHGEVADPAGVLAINERLRLVPGHCDPTCNLHDWYVGLRDGRVETLWPVSARGKVW